MFFPAGIVEPLIEFGNLGFNYTTDRIKMIHCIVRFVILYSYSSSQQKIESSMTVGKISAMHLQRPHLEPPKATNI